MKRRKPRSVGLRLLRAWLWLGWLGAANSSAADFSVVSPGSFYSINGTQPNPVLTLVRGQFYTFAITTALNHPFLINSPTGTTTNNNITRGIIGFAVPTNAANYNYRCSVHGFGGQILTIPPPVFRIENLNLGTNLVLRSTGTNNWNLVPQFSTNLGGSNWFDLIVQTNRFINGTNETICGRPPDNNAFIRIRALRN